MKTIKILDEQGNEKEIKISDESYKELQKSVKQEIDIDNYIDIHETYYQIRPDGLVANTTNDFDGYDIARIANGVFKTRHEAEKERDRVRTHRRLQRYADIVNDGWEPDWVTNDDFKHFIHYDHEDNCFTIDTWRKFQVAGIVVFKSEELAQQAIDYFGDELKNLL